MTHIDDPASAVAASLCLAARSVDDRGRTRRHPGECSWCAWPVPQLAEMIAGFNREAGYNPRRGTHERLDARVFAEQRRADQVAQVTEAQGLEPMEQPAAAPLDEELPAWL